jgi:hypothetical protein
VHSFVINARFLPRTLEEQQGLDEFAEVDEQFLKDNVRTLTVWDVAGRKWNVSRRDMKRLIADARKYSGWGGSPDLRSLLPFLAKDARHGAPLLLQSSYEKVRIGS